MAHAGYVSYLAKLLKPVLERSSNVVSLMLKGSLYNYRGLRRSWRIRRRGPLCRGYPFHDELLRDVSNVIGNFSGRKKAYNYWTRQRGILPQIYHLYINYALQKFIHL